MRPRYLSETAVAARRRRDDAVETRRLLSLSFPEAHAGRSENGVETSLATFFALNAHHSIRFGLASQADRFADSINRADAAVPETPRGR